MPHITLKRVTSATGNVAPLYPTTTLEQIISEGTGPVDGQGNATNESLSDYLDDRFILASTKGAANGVASLDADSKVPYAQLPDAVFGGLKFVGTITDNGDYGNLSDVIIGNPAAGTITVSADLDAIADNGQDTYDTQNGLYAYEQEKDKWIGYYWVVAGTNTVTMEEADNSDGSAYWGASAFDDGVAITDVGAVLEPGDWLVISGWDETLNSNNGGFLFSVINNTYTTAGVNTKGIVQLISTSANAGSYNNPNNMVGLVDGSSRVVTENFLFDNRASGELNGGADGANNVSNKLAMSDHIHDGRYYTESEIQNFFDGDTVITGYNKDNWDTAYNDKINSASFDDSTGVLTLTQQDNDTITVDLDGRYAESVAVAQTDSTDGLDVSVTGDTYTLKHHDTSSQASVNNSNGTVIQDITLDTFGHITGLNSYNLDNRYYTETEFKNWLDGTAIDSHYFTEIKYGANLASNLPSSGNIVGTILIETD